MSKLRQNAGTLIVAASGYGRDPMLNPKHWPRLSFGDRITLLQYGPRFYNEACTPSGVRIVRITDLDFQGNLDFEAMPTLDVCKEDRERYRLLPRDLLLAQSGATVGKTALIAEDAPDRIAGAYFIRMRFAADVHPLCTQMILRSRSVQSLIAEKSRQSAQQNFNGPAIRSLPLPLPPRVRQDSFACRSSQVQTLAANMNDHANELNRLFACLAHRAFRGELSVFAPVLPPSTNREPINVGHPRAAFRYPSSSCERPSPRTGRPRWGGDFGGGNRWCFPGDTGTLW